MNHFNRTRGEAVRRALLAIVEVRAGAGMPMPKHATLADMLGISACQVTRHLGVLQDAGAVSLRCDGRHVGIGEVRP